MGALLSHQDFSFFYDAIRMLPLELGTRFYTDYLRGDQYFKVTSAEQNLQRAQTQFNLVLDIERQEKALRDLVVKLESGRKKLGD